MSLLSSLPPQFNLPPVQLPVMPTSPPPHAAAPPPGEQDSIASLASIRTALATGKLQQHDVLRMLGDLSLNADQGEPSPTESGSGTTNPGVAGSIPTQDDLRPGSKSTSPGMEHMQGPMEKQLSSGSLPVLSGALSSRLWHTSSAPVVPGGVHTTLMVWVARDAVLCTRTIHLHTHMHTPRRLAHMHWVHPASCPLQTGASSHPSPRRPTPPCTTTGCSRSCCSRAQSRRALLLRTVKPAARPNWPRHRP